VEAAKLPPSELGAFLRREGLHEAELEAWRETVLGAFKPAPSKHAKSVEVRRVRELERELRRTDKALAEKSRSSRLGAMGSWCRDSVMARERLLRRATRPGSRMPWATFFSLTRVTALAEFPPDSRAAVAPLVLDEDGTRLRREGRVPHLAVG